MTITQLKEIILQTGNFMDNKYLDAYVNLILVNSNYTTQELSDRMFSKTTKYQYHHVIPVNKYNDVIPDSIPSRKRAFYARKIAACDPNNFMVSLDVVSHIKAHYFLAKCEITEHITHVNNKAIHILFNDLTEDQLKVEITNLTDELFFELKTIFENKINNLSTHSTTSKKREYQKRCWVRKDGIYKNILFTKLIDYLEEGWTHGAKGRPRKK